MVNIQLPSAPWNVYLFGTALLPDSGKNALVEPQVNPQVINAECSASVAKFSCQYQTTILRFDYQVQIISVTAVLKTFAHYYCLLFTKTFLNRTGYSTV